MSLDASVVRGADLADRLDRRPVLDTSVVYKGMVWDVRRDTVDLGAAGKVSREYVDHPGAVGAFEWELPAGLLDVAGEPPWLGAARELHEEADLIAGRWDVLIDHFASPGGSSEALRVFLARDVSEVQHGELFTREGEEHAMPVDWVDLEGSRGSWSTLSCYADQFLFTAAPFSGLTRTQLRC